MAIPEIRVPQIRPFTQLGPQSLPEPVTRDFLPVPGIRPPTIKAPEYAYPRVDVPNTTQNQLEPENTNESPKEEEDSGTQREGLGIPTIQVGGFEVPVPPKELVVTTATTAAVATVSATAAAVFAKPILDWLMKILKPAFKQIMAKIMKKVKGKSLAEKLSETPTTAVIQLPQLRYDSFRPDPLPRYHYKDQHKDSEDE